MAPRGKLDFVGTMAFMERGVRVAPRESKVSWAPQEPQDAEDGRDRKEREYAHDCEHGLCVLNSCNGCREGEDRMVEKDRKESKGYR